MDKEKIKELRQILISKIDQLLTLIGDSYKLVHFDFLKINKTNLDEQLTKIREIFEKNPGEDLEVLVMKKDIVNLTEDFLNKDIFDEIKKEKNKLKKVRYVYLGLIFILIIAGFLFYTNMLKVILNQILTNPQVIYKEKIVYKTGACFVSSGGNDSKNTPGDSLFVKAGTGANENLLGTGNLTGSNLSAKVLTGNLGTGYIALTGYNLSVTTLTGKNKTLKSIATLSGRFLIANISKISFLTGTVYSGKVLNYSFLTGDFIKLIGYKTGVLLTGKKVYPVILNYSSLVVSGNNLIFNFKLLGQLTGGVYLANLIKVKKVAPKPIFDIDPNLLKLKGKALEKYKEEKKQACPYTGTIKVVVRALNLRQAATKYSKRIALLRRNAKLKILSCQKNLKSNSWWYKVYVTKANLTGWVSTIGVGK